ncbi:MAG: hypothetical protein MJ132_01290, partial [Clostridia bacterium]|nr:hypothetical protein [Clostridia bacterium]
MLKKTVAVLIAVLLLVSGLFSVPALAETSDLPNSYSQVAQNDNFRLYADSRTGNFAVYDVAAKRYWYSCQSAVMDKDSEASQLNFGRIKTEVVSMVALEYVQTNTLASTAVPLYQNSQAYCVMEGNVDVKPNENGYRVEFYFSDIETTVPVEVTLTDKGVTVSIVGKDLKIGSKYYIVVKAKD